MGLVLFVLARVAKLSVGAPHGDPAVSCRSHQPGDSDVYSPRSASAANLAVLESHAARTPLYLPSSPAPSSSPSGARCGHQSASRERVCRSVFPRAQGGHARHRPRQRFAAKPIIGSPRSLSRPHTARPTRGARIARDYPRRDYKPTGCRGVATFRASCARRRVATRNYVGFSDGKCSPRVEDVPAFQCDALALSNVDGVVALTHTAACAWTDGRGMESAPDPLGYARKQLPASSSRLGSRPQMNALFFTQGLAKGRSCALDDPGQGRTARRRRRDRHVKEMCGREHGAPPCR